MGHRQRIAARIIAVVAGRRGHKRPPHALHLHAMRGGELATIEAMLAAWGRWAVSDRWGLGYARRNTIHRMMIEGATGAAIRGPYGTPMSVPELIERTDQAVSQLPAHLRAVIVEKYTGRGPTDQHHCRAIGINYAAWRLRLNCALHWLAGRLSR